MLVLRRSSLLVVLVACVLCVIASPAAARKPSNTGALATGTRYLALGDSVTFGYEEPNVVPAPNYPNAASLIGYPELIGSALRVNVANAACPGETSSSLINPSAQSNGCENAPMGSVAYRKQFPLHVRYKGSQLSYAVSYLRRHRNVRLVSLMIGANDVFLCQKTTTDGCLSASEQQAVFSRIARNTRQILSTIRNKARYSGRLVIVNYYSLNYNSALETSVSRGVNAAVDGAARRFGVKIAGGFGQFQRGSRIFGGDPCKAGLLTHLSSGSCGVHPTYAGQSLLEQAVLRAAISRR